MQIYKIKLAHLNMPLGDYLMLAQMSLFQAWGRIQQIVQESLRIIGEQWFG